MSCALQQCSTFRMTVIPVERRGDAWGFRTFYAWSPSASCARRKLAPVSKFQLARLSLCHLGLKAHGAGNAAERAIHLFFLVERLL